MRPESCTLLSPCGVLISFDRRCRVTKPSSISRPSAEAMVSEHLRKVHASFSRLGKIWPCLRPNQSPAGAECDRGTPNCERQLQRNLTRVLQPDNS